jgi:opacity protein-like surface antigen
MRIIREVSMSRIRRVTRSLGISAAALVIAAFSEVPNTYAESYIAGQFGVALPSIAGGLESIDITTQFIPGTTHSDLELSNSFLYGAKVGHYFNAARWFGLEAEAFYTTPHIKHQVHTIANPSVPGPPSSAMLQGAHFRVLTVAPFNLMFRYHKTRLQPYIGVGPGIFFARIQGEGLAPGSPESTSDNGRLGLNAKIGFEFYITRHLTAFGEWKYNYAPFSFKENVNLFPFPYGFDTTYRMHLVSFGIGYHF